MIIALNKIRSQASEIKHPKLAKCLTLIILCSDSAPHLCNGMPSSLHHVEVLWKESDEYLKHSCIVVRSSTETTVRKLITLPLEQVGIVQMQDQMKY